MAVIVAAICLSSSDGWAFPLLVSAPRPRIPAALALYGRGERAFSRADYAEAIEDLTLSFELVPAPMLLYDLGQAWRLSGQCDKAIDAYRRFLGSNPPERFRERTRALLEAPRSCPRHDDAEERVATARSPVASLQLAPTLTTGISAGISAGISPSLVIDHPSRRRTAYLTGGGAAMLAVAAGYFAWEAHRNGETVSRSYVPGPWSEEGQAAERAGLRDRGAAWGAGLGAVLAAAASLWLLRGSEP